MAGVQHTFAVLVPLVDVDILVFDDFGSSSYHIECTYVWK